MSSYIVRVAGCDGSTTVLLELDDTEAVAARRLAEAVNAASRSGCEPRMRIVAEAEATPIDREYLDRSRDDPL
ncbi:hypothetical protein [Parafrankia discariae]|uniref:hypothetical protein n=1 Tax=Parafrankia discariae TaxID=365528 RepID=UPI000368A192|nr:hypothetical protein [Parafrankia discariae]